MCDNGFDKIDIICYKVPGTFNQQPDERETSMQASSVITETRRGTFDQFKRRLRGWRNYDNKVFCPACWAEFLKQTRAPRELKRRKEAENEQKKNPWAEENPEALCSREGRSATKIIDGVKWVASQYRWIATCNKCHNELIYADNPVREGDFN